jgi:hypothetical protein
MWLKTQTNVIIHFNQKLLQALSFCIAKTEPKNVKKEVLPQQK